jgi:hypothetical protein
MYQPSHTREDSTATNIPTVQTSLERVKVRIRNHPAYKRIARNTNQQTVYSQGTKALLNRTSTRILQFLKNAAQKPEYHNTI